MAHQGHLSGGGMSVIQSNEINNNDKTSEGLHGKLKDRNYYMSQQSAKTKQLLAAKVGYNVRTKHLNAYFHCL